MNAASNNTSSTSLSSNKLDKLLAVEEHGFKINSMTYHEDCDMLSIGLSNGQIVNYTLEIESFAYNSGDDNISPSGGTKVEPRKGSKSNSATLRLVFR